VRSAQCAALNQREKLRSNLSSTYANWADALYIEYSAGSARAVIVVCPQEFGVSRKLPRSLQAELIQHFEAVYEHKSVFNEEAIMDDLPAHIRSRVVKVMYEDMIDNSMFFDGFELYNETAIMKICLKLKATVALDQDDIYCEGDIGEDMFFLQDGCVHMTAEREYLDEGLRTTSSLSRQDSTTRTQKESVLFVEF
jgi:hypothetical protein